MLTSPARISLPPFPSAVPSGCNWCPTGCSRPQAAPPGPSLETQGCRIQPLLTSTCHLGPAPSLPSEVPFATVCQSCCYPRPQTGRLRTAERAESRCQRAASSGLWACGAADTLGPLVWQPRHPSPAPVSQATSVHLSLSLSSEDTSPVRGRVRVPLLPSQLHLQRSCFQIKSPSQVLGSER